VSKHLKEKEDKILEIIEQLCAESSRGIPILVEGKKDIEALRDLGVVGRIFSMKTGGKTTTQILMDIEEARIREIILLLDFDEKGKKMTHKIKQDLERDRIKSNLHFWSAFQGILGREVPCIEGINAYLITLRRKLE
jgi:5S rRNA maturation endonuclease (ribonuclease M5)